MSRAGAAVAQLVEHVIRNDGVGGSSPFSGTSFLTIWDEIDWCAPNAGFHMGGREPNPRSMRARKTRQS